MAHIPTFVWVLAGIALFLVILLLLGLHVHVG